MYRDILIPTDGSEGARRAIREAVDLADLTGATLHGLAVVDTREYNTLPESKWARLRADLDAEREADAAVVREAAEAADVDVVTAVRRGVPHQEILSYVEETDCDLVVMGTHGRTGLDRMLLGSVTENVVRASRVPVHVVRIDGGRNGGNEESANAS